MARRLMILSILMLVAAFAFAGGGQEEAAEPMESSGAAEAEVDEMWMPEKPIQIIVPWSAGGSTDQMTRVTAGVLEPELGQPVVVVNQPGASGSVGTKGALDAPHDGYTWTAGAAADLGAYKVRGLLDTTLDDWMLFLTVANVSVISVNPDTPYEDFGDLLDAMGESGANIPVATAGQLSAGHNAMLSIEKHADISWRHVTYDGGNPAVIATVAGETEVVPQLAVEQADMLAGGRLRALAVLADTALELDGYGTIPPITDWLPEYQPAPNYFGIWVPKDAPQEVIDTFGQLWDTVIADSEELKQYAAERGAVFAPSWGEEAVDDAMPFLSNVAWTLHEAGETVMSPEEIGIPRPE